MDTLYLEATKYTPEVKLDADKGIFDITGSMYPEYCEEFLQPVLAWFGVYRNRPNRETKVSIRLEYINTDCTRTLYNLFLTLKKIPNTSVVWLYPTEGGKDMKEMGEDYAEDLDLPFEIKNVEK